MFEPCENCERRLHDLLHQQQPEVLSWLLKDYAPRLLVALYHHFSAYIPLEDREEIVRDTLIWAFENGPRYDPHLASVATWLNVKAHHLATQFVRRNNYAGVDIDVLAETLAAAVERETHEQQGCPSRRMQRALRQLPPRRAQVVQLYYYHGYPIDEIAAQLHIAEVTVRSHLSRAYAQLRRIFDVEQEQYCPLHGHTQA